MGPFEFFGLPVVAFDAGAVKETLRGGGVLLQDKDPAVVSELLGFLSQDQSFRAAVLATQEPALAAIRAEDLGGKLDDGLKALEASS